MSRQLSFPIALAAALLLAITHNFPFFQLATASQNHPENSYSVNSPLELPQSSNSYPEFSEIETRQDNMGACGKNPCMNGGNCNVLATGVGGGRVSKDEMFVCHCMTGFYGRKCEKGSGVSLNCTDTEMSVSVAHSLTGILTPIFHRTRGSMWLFCPVAWNEFYRRKILIFQFDITVK